MKTVMSQTILLSRILHTLQMDQVQFHHHLHHLDGHAQMEDVNQEVEPIVPKMSVYQLVLLDIHLVIHVPLKIKVFVVITAMHVIGHGHPMIQHNGLPKMQTADAMLVEDQDHHHHLLLTLTEILVPLQILDSVDQAAMHVTGHGLQMIQHNGIPKMPTADAMQMEKKLKLFFNEKFI